MKGNKDTQKRSTARTGTIALWMLAAFALLCPAEVFAQVIIQSPTTYGMNQPFQMRTSSRPHMGNDFLVPSGTTLNTPGPVTCPPPDLDGWGTYARVELGCNVVLLYAHLTSCVAGSTSVISGGLRGAVGAGNSEGAHLHYEVTSNGCHVDPQQAFGQDLCLASVKDNLYAQARNTLGRHAACNAPSGVDQTNTQTPPVDNTQGEQAVVEVPTGGVNPATGMVNLGPPYVYVLQRDGRVRIEAISSSDETQYPPLGPTTENVVQEGNEDGTPSSCAADTWAEMVNQSVLMVRRETLMNQSLIAKPDSILAYSCFYDHALHAGETLGILSENQGWVNRQVEVGFGESRQITLNVELSQGSLDGAINIGALNAYQRLLAGNFGHAFLGGRLAGPTLPEHSDDGDHDRNNLQMNQPCGVMNAVWEAARDLNMRDIANPFPSFEELIEPNTDPRIYPQNMSCMNTGITQNMIDIADGAQTAFSPVPARTLGAAQEDEEDEYDCGAPFYTGVTVTRRRGAGIITTEFESPDGFCARPGCSFINGQCVSSEAP